jgi:hypothetical protein
MTLPTANPKYTHLGWVLAIVPVFINLWPAMLNGFPIVYDDTNVYIGLPQTIHSPLPPFYSIFVWIVTRVLPLDAVLIVQSCCIVYVVSRAFMVFANCSFFESILLSSLTFATTQVPWLASWLTTDWLGGCGILALATFCASTRSGHDLPLIGIVLFSCLASTANLFVLVPVFFVILLVQITIAKASVNKVKIIAAIFTLSVSVVTLYLFNTIVNHKPTLAIGGSARLFNKLVDIGVARPYLVSRCHNGDAHSCRIADEVARYVEREEFLWGSKGHVSLANRDDAWNDRSGYYAHLSFEIVREYPVQILHGAITDVMSLASKFVLSKDGRDLIAHDTQDDFVRYRIKTLYGKEVQRFLMARQQRGLLESDFPAGFYTLLTYVSYLIATAVFVLALGRRNRELTALSTILILALIWSTLIHGGLSSPIPRYSVKSSWLAAFLMLVGIVAFVHRRKARQISSLMDSATPL